MEHFAFLQSLIVLANLHFTKFGEGKFASFYITEDNMKVLLSDIKSYYAILCSSIITLHLVNGDKVVVKPANIDKCIAYSNFSAKPRLLFFNNPNDLTSNVKEVTFTK